MLRRLVKKRNKNVKKIKNQKREKQEVKKIKNQKREKQECLEDQK